MLKRILVIAVAGLTLTLATPIAANAAKPDVPQAQALKGMCAASGGEVTLLLGSESVEYRCSGSDLSAARTDQAGDICDGLDGRWLVVTFTGIIGWECNVPT